MHTEQTAGQTGNKSNNATQPAQINQPDKEAAGEQRDPSMKPTNEDGQLGVDDFSTITGRLTTNEGGDF